MRSNDSYLKSKAYRIIKDKITRCELQPGSLILEKALIDEIGASRTPIREAISKLEEEHLVVVYPKHGIFVSQVTIKDIIDIYAMRIIVESFAVRLAALVLEPDQIQPFKDLWLPEHAPLSPDEQNESDREFHYLIAQSTGNKYLLQTFTTLFNQASRIRMMSLLRMEKRLEETKGEHLHIIEALLKRDEDEAEKYMKIHLTSARETALRLFPAG
ncbi:MAG: GntR family transcriptional regulator [Treponema sp.]|nr:GntR family transcriptional regulator [Treponema sp.]